jgi:hypothetical protein
MGRPPASRAIRVQRKSVDYRRIHPIGRLIEGCALRAVTIGWALDNVLDDLVSVEGETAARSEGCGVEEESKQSENS